MTQYPGPTTSTTEPAFGASPWHRRRPDAGDPHTSFGFWLTVLGVACVSVLMMTWGVSTALGQKGSENLLRFGLSLPKLNSIHGERKAIAFPTSEPRASAPAFLKDQTTSQPPAPPPVHSKTPVAEPLRPVAATPEPPRLIAGPELQGIAPVEMPTPIETCDDPVVYLHQCTAPRGDSPMIRNWKALTTYSLLSAAAILAQPAVVFAQEKEELSKAIDALTKRITALEKKEMSDADKKAIADIVGGAIKKLEDGALATLDGKVSGLQVEQGKQDIRLSNQQKLIDQLSKRIDAINTTPSSDKAVLEALKGIQETIAKLGPTEKRLMMSPPQNGAATTGQVMLVNHYNDELLFVINGVGHRVEPNRSKMVPVPVGAVGVEVFSTRFGVFHRQGTTLAAGDTFTLTATPPR